MIPILSVVYANFKSSHYWSFFGNRFIFVLDHNFQNKKSKYSISAQLPIFRGIIILEHGELLLPTLKTFPRKKER